MAYDCVGSTERELQNYTNRFSSGSIGLSWLPKNIEAMSNGFLETFMNGKVLIDTSGTITYGQLAQPTSAAVYLMMTQPGFVLYTSDGTGNASCGIIDAEAAAEYRGVLRMVLRDTNGAQGIGFHQLNCLSIPSKTSFEVNFDISSWTHRGYVAGVAFAEIGVMGAQGTAAEIATATQEPGNGEPMISLRLVAGRATPRIDLTTSGSVTTGTSFDLPAASSTAVSQCVLSIVYTYDSRGVGTTSFRLNGRDVSAPMTGIVTGPFQVFARLCHGASYASATHTPPILDLDSVQLINPRSRA
jgi:hypothetical protein